MVGKSQTFQEVLKKLQDYSVGATPHYSSADFHIEVIALENGVMIKTGCPHGEDALKGEVHLLNYWF